MLNRINFPVGEIGLVAFEVAMFVAFGDACTVHGEGGAFAGAAVAGHGEFAGTVGAGNELPAGSVARLAIFERHRRKHTGVRGGRQAVGGLERCGRKETVRIATEAQRKAEIGKVRKVETENEKWKKKETQKRNCVASKARASWDAACCAPTLDFIGHIGTGEKAA